MRERYDPNQPVCNNQDDFNQAFVKAIKYTGDQQFKKAGAWVYVFVGLMLVFFVWAVLLAMKAPADQRVVHLIFAVIFAPAYVISYYINQLVAEKAVFNMGSCGMRYN